MALMPQAGKRASAAMREDEASDTDSSASAHSKHSRASKGSGITDLSSDEEVVEFDSDASSSSFPVLNPPPFPSRILHRRRISQALLKLTLALMRRFMEQMIRFNPGIRTLPGRMRCSPLRTIVITMVFGPK